MAIGHHLRELKKNKYYIGNIDRVKNEKMKLRNWAGVLVHLYQPEGVGSYIYIYNRYFKIYIYIYNGLF